MSSYSESGIHESRDDCAPERGNYMQIGAKNRVLSFLLRPLRGLIVRELMLFLQACAWGYLLLPAQAGWWRGGRWIVFTFRELVECAGRA